MGKLLITIIVFLVIGGLIIKTAYDIDFNKDDDRKNFFFKFASWLGALGGNIKTITGQVIKMDWLPDTENTNLTNNTK